MWRLYYQLSPEGRHRFFNEFMPLLHDTKHDIMGDRDDDSYYLVYLGSKPSARGKGYARKLIESMSLRVSSSRFLFLEAGLAPIPFSDFQYVHFFVSVHFPVLSPFLPT